MHGTVITTDVVRRRLAKKLVDLHLRFAKQFAEIDGIKSSLIANAENAGGGFREVFEKKGQVTVAAPKAKECRGTIAVLDQAAFKALPDSRREKLIADGLVTEQEDWSGAFYGRATVKLFT
jgi:hypothetical protein